MKSNLQMVNKKSIGESPLNKDDITRIDEVKLEALEKHYLRLLAHCLESFKSMPSEHCSNGLFPNEQTRMQWCLRQTSLKDQKDFIPVLLEQLAAAATQLEKLACRYDIQPMDLTLDLLIQSFLENPDN